MDHAATRRRLFLALVASLAIAQVAAAENPDGRKRGKYVIEILNHRFVPAELEVPAGKKIKLRIINRDATPEEFESYPLNREKVVAGKRRITVFIGPLKPGRYPFFGEFHPKTAQGVIVVK